MSDSKRVVENIVEIELTMNAGVTGTPYRIRAWFPRGDSGPTSHADRMTLLNAAMAVRARTPGSFALMSDPYPYANDIVFELSTEMQRTPNALQVSFGDQGVVIYPEWP